MIFTSLVAWLERIFKQPTIAESYLSKSVDRADYAYREKRLQQKGLL